MKNTVNVVLTDIEGTTSSIAFVHDTLFPYASEALPGFIKEHGDEPAVRAELNAAAIEAGCDPRDSSLVLANLLAWISADRKVTPLKALQGMVWEQGYAKGELQSHVYPDVVSELRRWKEQGLDLYVYSSGSVAAQKLLFAHTSEGDLSALFSGYFDTRIGGKKQSRSYTAICAEIGCQPASVLFLSDVAEELDAARSSGLQCVQVVRAEDGTVPAEGHKQIRRFDELPI